VDLSAFDKEKLNIQDAVDFGPVTLGCASLSFRAGVIGAEASGTNRQAAYSFSRGQTIDFFSTHELYAGHSSSVKSHDWEPY